MLPKKPDLKLPLYVSDSIEYIDRMASPRFIKTHLPYKLLPKKLKDRSTEAKVRPTIARKTQTDTGLVRFASNSAGFCTVFRTDNQLRRFYDQITVANVYFFGLTRMRFFYRQIHDWKNDRGFLLEIDHDRRCDEAEVYLCRIALRTCDVEPVTVVLSCVGGTRYLTESGL